MNATRALGYMYIIFKNASIVLSCFRMRVYVCTLYTVYTEQYCCMYRAIVNSTNDRITFKKLTTCNSLH